MSNFSPCKLHLFKKEDQQKEYICKQPFKGDYIWEDCSTKEEKVKILEDIFEHFEYQLCSFLILIKSTLGRISWHVGQIEHIGNTIDKIDYVIGVIFIDYNALIPFSLNYSFDLFYLHRVDDGLSAECENIFTNNETTEKSVFWDEIRSGYKHVPVRKRIIGESAFQNLIGKAVKLDKLMYFCYFYDLNPYAEPRCIGKDILYPYRGIGLLTQLDQNKEFFETLKEKTPELMKECGGFELEDYLFEHEKFFLSLCSILEIPKQLNAEFPQKWTGERKLYYHFVNDYGKRLMKSDYEFFILRNGIVEETDISDALENGKDNYYVLCGSYNGLIWSVGNSVRDCLLSYGKHSHHLSNKHLKQIYLDGKYFQDWIILPTNKELFEAVTSKEHDFLQANFSNGYASLKSDNAQNEDIASMCRLKEFMHASVNKSIDDLKRQYNAKTDAELTEELIFCIFDLQHEYRPSKLNKVARTLLKWIRTIRKNGIPSQFDELMFVERK